MALRVNIYFLVAGLTFLLPVSVFGQTPLVDGPEWTDIGQDAVLTCNSTANIRIVEWARSDFGNSLGESDLVVNLRTSTGTVININNTRYGFDKDATEYPLTIKSVNFDDGGTYWCILAVDDFQYIYAMKELRVRVLPKSVKMSDLTGSYPTTGGTAYLVEGLNHQFICEAPDINPGASFKWSLAGREIVEDSSSDFTSADNFITSNSTLTLSPVWNNHGEMLQCQASNKEGHVGLFTMVTLDVKVIPKASSLSLSDSDGAVHDEVVVDEDTPHLFTCQVLGTRPGARIEWYLNGVQRRVLNQGPAGAVGLVTTSDTLSLIPTRADHGQMVTCEASIAESPRPYPSLNVTLIVNDMGYPDDWDLVWSNGGLPITGPTTRPTASDGRYNFTSTFNYTPRRQDNGNIIKCTANRASLTPGPKGIYGPVDVQFCARIVSVTQSPPVLTAGGKATLSCTPESSNPATTLTWSKEDVELTTPTSQPNSGGAYGGRVTRVSYTTGVLNKTNNGEVYKCCATNPAISTCATNLCDRHILSVQYSPEFTSLKQIPDAFATEGSDVTLTCVVDAKPRPVGINWKKQGSNKTFNSAFIDDTSTLTLINIRREQAGNYTCRANNGVPTDDPSSDAVSSPLTIIVHYEASITNKFNNIVGAKHGGVTVITCITRANPKPIISWYNPNDTIISPDYGSGKFLIETDTTSGDRIYGFTVTSTLTIRGVDSWWTTECIPSIVRTALKMETPYRSILQHQEYQASQLTYKSHNGLQIP
ncbi:hemicentin-1-like isoform X2 [Acanthaster planci]|uniref:Hemicentin-1-like isoform X2 n=1 Tax=Acanthaster planci TaxID=133434 RepID=A0A8B7ZT79_ACAPL|nr:hemicentin-1-like isoform X2 [Acanthaster planci]